MKILVVDDEALLVKGIRFNLQNEGYEVITGSDGLEALQKVQEQQPDLVVLDVMMPNMDGMTACAKIREFSDVPIILLTAKTDDIDKLMGFDYGADVTAVFIGPDGIQQCFPGIDPVGVAHEEFNHIEFLCGQIRHYAVSEGIPCA